MGGLLTPAGSQTSFSFSTSLPFCNTDFSAITQLFGTITVNPSLSTYPQLLIQANNGTKTAGIFIATPSATAASFNFGLTLFYQSR